MWCLSEANVHSSLDPPNTPCRTTCLLTTRGACLASTPTHSKGAENCVGDEPRHSNGDVAIPTTRLTSRDTDWLFILSLVFAAAVALSPQQSQQSLLLHCEGVGVYSCGRSRRHCCSGPWTMPGDMRTRECSNGLQQRRRLISQSVGAVGHSAGQSAMGHGSRVTSHES